MAAERPLPLSHRAVQYYNDKPKLQMIKVQLVIWKFYCLSAAKAKFTLTEFSQSRLPHNPA
ncbi:hypothetical protein CMK12_00590 [Candidatus Poribacteria bacterium]|nr:hypothetical protein [Candidatus Poribacteria bacterium]